MMVLRFSADICRSFAKSERIACGFREEESEDRERMKRYSCVLLLTLLILLLAFGIPTGLLIREHAIRDLVAAIKANDTDKALDALKVGAIVNASVHNALYAPQEIENGEGFIRASDR